MKPCTFALTALFALSGCAGSPVYKPSEVDIPISTPCQFDIPPAPAYQLGGIPPGAPITVKTKAIIHDLATSRDYSLKLRAAMQACNDSKDTAAVSPGS